MHIRLEPVTISWLLTVDVSGVDAARGGRERHETRYVAMVIFSQCLLRMMRRCAEAWPLRFRGVHKHRGILAAWLCKLVAPQIHDSGVLGAHDDVSCAKGLIGMAGHRCVWNGFEMCAARSQAHMLHGCLNSILKGFAMGKRCRGTR